MSQSQLKGIQPRCPFASVHRCPRFYQSVWLLGEGGGASKIEPEEDKILLEKWSRSDLWPATREQEPSVSGSENNPSMFNRFCPEASFDRFGLFATNLYAYADSIDLETAHEMLGRQGTQGEDWRWHWTTIYPQHYAECPLYSLLLSDSKYAKTIKNDTATKPPELLDVRPDLWGIRVDLNPLVRRFKEWLSSRLK